MSNPCIICAQTDGAETVEHIIPRALGNLHYILPKGLVCSRCNHRLGLIENRIMSSPIFIEERRRLGMLRDMKQSATANFSSMDIQMFIGKMVYAGLYRSRPKYSRELPDSIRQMLAREHNHAATPYAPDDRLIPFRSVPRLFDRFRLARNHMELKWSHDGLQVTGQFRFGNIILTSRLAS